MGINPRTLYWLNSLYEAGAFQGCKSVLELGPQDFFFVTEDILQKLSGKLLGNDPEKVRDFVASPEIGGKKVYNLFGIDNYKSVDLFDPRADFRLDLNKKTVEIVGFDVVTNFGTAEHVFNITQAFENIHNFLRVGGIALHVLPAYGDIPHGFYNIHPMLYSLMANANSYEIISLVYVKDAYNDAAKLMQDSPTQSQLPQVELLSPLDIADINMEFARNSALFYLKEKPYPVYDYVHCALRKTKEGAFVYPSQF